jgi:hypothetical protein
LKAIVGIFAAVKLTIQQVSKLFRCQSKHYLLPKVKKKKKNAKSDKFFGGHFIFRKQHLIGRHSYLEVVMLFFLVGKVVDQKVGYMVVLSDVINFLFILFASCLLSTRIHCASSLNFYNNGEANCTTKKLLLPEIHFWLFPE